MDIQQTIGLHVSMKESISCGRLGRSLLSITMGRFWKIPPVGVYPLPPQGADLPIWVGGVSPRALRTAAERGSGSVIPVYLTTPELIRSIRRELPAGHRVAAGIFADQADNSALPSLSP